MEEKLRVSEKQGAARNRSSWFRCSFLRQYYADDEMEQAIFQGLRQEFLLKRSEEPPFAACTEPLSEDFLYCRYLALAQTHVLQHTVDVEVETWMFFAFGTIVFYGLAALTGGDMTAIAWMWVATGWIILAINIIFERHVSNLRRLFVPQRLLASLEHGKRTEGEEDCSSSPWYEFSSADELPAWTKIALHDNECSQGSTIESWFRDGTPTRSQRFFWMERRGPHFYVLLLQANLIFAGLYAGLLLLSFVPYIYQKQHIEVSILYLTLALIPLAGIVFNKQHLIAMLAQVCSIGSFRKPQLVFAVLQEEQTNHLVRTFLVACKLRRAALQVQDVQPTTPHASKRQSFTVLEKHDIAKTFDAIDTDKSGSISRPELAALFSRLGAPVKADDIERIFAATDRDGDGEIQRSEFLRWYKEQTISEDDLTVQDHSQAIFDMLCYDSHKEWITGHEFTTRVDTLDMGFSAVEVGAILHKLDWNGDGKISADKFASLLRKHYPRELTNDSLDV
jgi:Ca2+-binding EF-hand superfamily protein